ncbi:hypothetical protein F2Q70_00041434 [Brassica cretica]|uniref:Zinc knuckle CX2CX4HX4C domain-containing protein n=1 Tax=Brassica cretica TaxID=69181 RepID=A0A8S9KAV1_BRACR|nr:hypothetical protein F2Q70_00041434 [Brassica cretica]KAF2616491.1 hypothetical protein F2Q68_00042093 [Brassica cretica]
MKLEISVAGNIKQVELQYENLEKHCFSCKALSHEVGECPSSKVRAFTRDLHPAREDISQRRTLEKLDADRRRREARKHDRALSEASTHPRSDSQHVNSWNGVNRTDGRSTNSRLPARERLSGTHDSNTASQRPIHSHSNRGSLRNEWRPIAVSSQSGTSSKRTLTTTSHTPSPRPPRECETPQREKTRPTHQDSGDGTLLSNERRSALDRISQPAERIPLLQDGMANSASGRLQEVDIQYLEDTLPLHASGGSNIPSSSKTPRLSSTGINEGMLDRSPIRSLSEDRLHVSLRLGPLQDSDSGNGKKANKDHDKSPPTGLRLGKGRQGVHPAARKRILRSPNQGAALKKRKVTKTTGRKAGGQEASGRNLESIN